MSHGGNVHDFIRKNGFAPLDFSANISPLGLSDKAKNAVISSLENAHIYPDSKCTELRNALAEKMNISQGYAVFGNGASDLIDRVIRAAGPKKAAVVCPTFTEYERSLDGIGAEIIRYILDEKEGFTLDDSFLDSLDDSVDMAIICNPNNPTGVLYSKELMTAILEKCRKHDILLLIDECFVDFTDGGASMLDKCDCDNLIVLNAFTKSYGMAGLRLGWCVCKNENLRNKIEALSPPWSISSVAQAAAIASLKDEDYMNKMHKIVSEGRAFLERELKKLGLEIFPSSCNFILFKSEHTDLSSGLEGRGVLLRSCADFTGLNEHYYRTAVLDMSKNRTLISHIKEVLHGR